MFSNHFPTENELKIFVFHLWQLSTFLVNKQINKYINLKLYFWNYAGATTWVNIHMHPKP